MSPSLPTPGCDYIVIGCVTVSCAHRLSKRQLHRGKVLCLFSSLWPSRSPSTQ